MSHSLPVPAGTFSEVDQAVYDIIRGRRRAVEVAFNALAGEIVFHGDSGLMGRELGLCLSRELRGLAEAVVGLADGIDAAVELTRNGEDQAPPKGCRE